MAFPKISKPVLFRFLFISFFTLVISFATYRICYFVAYRFFFDKIFYQKSVALGYGYGLNPHLTLASFGPRSQDVLALDHPDLRILGASDDRQYRVVLIGDSYAWGMGINYADSVSQVLKQKLNTVRPTQMITLAKPGDSLLDYYASYKKIDSVTKADLYVVLMVFNDLALNNDNRLPGNDYEQIVHNCQTQFPQNPVTYWLDWASFKNEHPRYTENDIDTAINHNIDQSWSNPTNLCLLNTVAKRFPANTIFLITDNYAPGFSTPYYQTYQQALESNSHTVINSNQAKNLPQYSIYWQNNPWTSFRISSTEFHPNTLAHRMYADVLFNEITTNSQWHFQTN